MPPASQPSPAAGLEPHPCPLLSFLAAGQTCEQVKKAQQCYATWLVAQGWCDATCGRCRSDYYTAPPGANEYNSLPLAPLKCADVAPPGTTYPCADQAKWGKVGRARGSLHSFRVQQRLRRRPLGGGGGAAVGAG